MDEINYRTTVDILGAENSLRFLSVIQGYARNISRGYHTGLCHCISGLLAWNEPHIRPYDAGGRPCFANVDEHYLCACSIRADSLEGIEIHGYGASWDFEKPLETWEPIFEKTFQSNSDSFVRNWSEVQPDDRSYLVDRLDISRFLEMFRHSINLRRPLDLSDRDQAYNLVILLHPTWTSARRSGLITPLRPLDLSERRFARRSGLTLLAMLNLAE